MLDHHLAFLRIFRLMDVDETVSNPTTVGLYPRSTI
jgi:hypothetical protein